MARSSLSKSSPHLNLSRRQTVLFQRIILSGNRMADTLIELETPKESKKLATGWGKLMVELVMMLCI